MNDFDVLNIELEGSNLVEASAGTGKTYSLAILALRLVIEKEIPLDEILMVTFTNAATAELEVRIRKFVREAYRYIVRNECDEDPIKRVVDKAVNLSGREDVIKRLKESVSKLDETSVMTIHSFCQNTLREFQFETEQADDVDIIADLSDLVNFEVNEFWRREVSTVDPGILEFLRKTLDKSLISMVINKVLSRRIFTYEEKDESDLKQEFDNNIELFKQAENNFREHVIKNFEDIKIRAQESGHARNFVADCSDYPEDFINKFIKKERTPAYFQTIFGREDDLANELDNAEKTLKESVLDLRNVLLDKAVRRAVPNMTSRLRELNALSYDELISRVHDAAMNNLDKLKGPLVQKYRAVFIDEFQDTDRLQYEIFDRVFHGISVIFYIGDPKQSIYGWRSADLATYVRAREKIGGDRSFSMDVNFRSTSRMVESMNKFFKPDDNYDTFSSDEIIYREVRARQSNIDLFYDGNPVVPISITESPNKDQIYQNVCDDISRLLVDDRFIIGEDRHGRRVVPSDIAVLVRSARQGKELKSILSRVGIPSVTVDETKVMESGQAVLIKRIMETVIRPNRKSINRLLADELFAFELEKLLKLNDEKILELFTLLRETWIDSGIFNMLSMFLKKFFVVDKCLSQLGSLGQRAITNFFQIMEILHDAEIKRKLNPDDLISWLGKAGKSNNTGEEYEQRIESDEKAVRIMTIHKCKGLTFNIVFAPFLDFYKFPNDAIEYRDENGDYRFTFKPDETAIEFYDKQLDQENRRLIYVAMTRAVYKTYLCNNISPKYKTTGELRDFLKFYGDEESKSGFAQWLEFNPETEAVQDDFQLEISRETAKPRTVVGIPEFRKSWDIHSFSSLNHKHEYVSADLIDIDDEYDNFVFNVMPKGAKAGLFLHSIFENLDFANPYDYREVLEKSGAFYSSIYRDEHADNYLKLVNHCLGVKISNMDGEDFSLNEVINDKKLPEMEFFFSIDRHQKSQITRLIPEIEFTTDPEIEGLIHGFIDLFFEHNGKYYIIDWKSNFLGNRLEDYNQEGLVAGMKGSNYYLQYYLYTIAVKRYLSHKLPNFDYERDFGGAIYVFLRGVRKNDNSTGIYFDRPLKERIEALELVFGP